MMRVRRKLRPEIGEEQNGFVTGKGTNNAIYIIRMLIERSIEVKTDLFLCFIDYTKAFDKVKHKEIISMLKDINIDSKDLRIIENIYWQQTAAIKINNQIGEFHSIRQGVRQGCVLSPDLFNLYSEMIFRSIENMPGIAVGGYNVNNLRYADDTVLVAKSEKEIQQLITTIVEEKRKQRSHLEHRENRGNGYI